MNTCVIPVHPLLLKKDPAKQVVGTNNKYVLLPKTVCCYNTYMQLSLEVNNMVLFEILMQFDHDYFLMAIYACLY